MRIELGNAKFLVTGGCGFIGSNIVKRLIESGVRRCYVLDNLFTGEKRFLPQRDAVTFVEGSITDQKMLDDLVPEVDYIINCAAVNIMAAQENAFHDLEVNAGGTLRLLETARRFGRVKKVVYTSSGSIYGNPDYLPILETARSKPMSNYAVSKLAGESYARVYYLLHDLPTAIVRYSNVYGPNQSPNNPYCGVIGKFIRSALNGKEISIYGSGLQTRDFTYVDDTVDATIATALEAKAVGQTFNVATGYEISIRTLAQTIFEILETPPRITHVDRRDIDNISRRCLNIEAIRTTLKWEPLFDVSEGLKRTIEWYRQTEGQS